VAHHATAPSGKFTIAHGIEEQTRERLMRRIDPINPAYDQPSSRAISAFIGQKKSLQTKIIDLAPFDLRIAAA